MFLRESERSRLYLGCLNLSHYPRTGVQRREEASWCGYSSRYGLVQNWFEEVLHVFG